MKRLIVFAMLLTSTLAFAQHRFSCRFVATDEEGKPVLSGTAYVQDDCYRLEMPSMKVWSNGKDRWTYSVNSDELLIQADDMSFLKDIDVSRSSGDSATVKWENYTIELKEIKQVEEPWSAVFFIIDPDVIGDDTIITDLR